MALVIKACGVIDKVTPKADGKFTLEELQGFVGGYIEFVPLPANVTKTAVMVCNEDGKIIGLPINVLASVIASQDIVGDVLFCEPTSIESGDE